MHSLSQERTWYTGEDYSTMVVERVIVESHSGTDTIVLTHTTCPSNVFKEL